jgi:hypothetical protein
MTCDTTPAELTAAVGKRTSSPGTRGWGRQREVGRRVYSDRTEGEKLEEGYGKEGRAVPMQNDVEGGARWEGASTCRLDETRSSAIRLKYHSHIHSQTPTAAVKAATIREVNILLE